MPFDMLLPKDVAGLGLKICKPDPFYGFLLVDVNVALCLSLAVTQASSSEKVCQSVACP